jgi:hypothetical protein
MKLNKSCKSKKAGPGCALFVGLSAFVFLAIGLWTTFQALNQQTWQEVPCEVERLEIRDDRNDDPPFTITTSFTFQAEGETQRGGTFSNDSNSGDDYEKLFQKLRSAQSRSTCYYEPNNPKTAILSRGHGNLIGGLLFGLVGGILLFVAFAIWKQPPESKRALSAKTAKGAGGEKVAFAFFAVFFLAGLAVLIFFVIPSARKAISARSWFELPATVIWSTVRSHDSDDGTTYSPDIFYRYHFKDAEYRSNTYSFVEGSSSGYDRKKEVVEQYPRGHEFTAYVNPDKPWQATILRNPGWSALFWLFPLPFLAIGVGGIWWALFKKESSADTAIPTRGGTTPSHLAEATPESSEPQHFSGSSRGKRIAKFAGHFFFALIWCGITAFPVTFFYESWSKGDPDWFLSIFVVTFGLAGLVIVGTLPHSFLAIFSPYFKIRWSGTSRAALHPGSTSKLSWEQSAGNGTMTEANFTLIGMEEATYQQGTRSTTARSTFFKKELYTTQHPDQISHDEMEFTIPSDALPSFQSEHNKIRWFLQHHVAVKRRPNVKDEIELVLHPFDEDHYR